MVLRKVQLAMPGKNLHEGWSAISEAPRDGTPVILWLLEDETPPEAPKFVGYWTANPNAGIGYRRLFGDPPSFCSDRQVRGWRQLLRGE